MRVVAFSPMTGRSTSVPTGGRRCGYREGQEDIPVVPHGLADISADRILNCPYGNTEQTSVSISDVQLSNGTVSMSRKNARFFSFGEFSFGRFIWSDF